MQLEIAADIASFERGVLRLGSQSRLARSRLPARRVFTSGFAFIYCLGLRKLSAFHYSAMKIGRKDHAVCGAAGGRLTASGHSRRLDKELDHAGPGWNAWRKAEKVLFLSSLERKLQPG